jgi:hypothetical protein
LKLGKKIRKRAKSVYIYFHCLPDKKKKKKTWREGGRGNDGRILGSGFEIERSGWILEI